MSIKQKTINIMNALTISKREELCRNLNMNFDEASELFSDETLESMQMAKVNGGIVITATFLISFGVSIAGGIVANYIYNLLTCTRGTETLNSANKNSSIILKGSDGFSFEVPVGWNGKIDSVITRSPNGTEIKVYGISTTPTPTQSLLPYL